MKSSLFQGVSENDLETMLSCLGATERKYKKNDVILLAGTKVSSVGILVEGDAQITRDDAEGNRARSAKSSEPAVHPVSFTELLCRI